MPITNDSLEQPIQLAANPTLFTNSIVANIQKYRVNRQIGSSKQVVILEIETLALRWSNHYLFRTTRFEKTLINSLFQEYLMKGSVIYEYLLQKGGDKEALKLVMMQLNERFPKRFPKLEERLTNKVKTLSLSDLEDLAVSLLNFKDVSDLDAWLGYPEL